MPNIEELMRKAMQEGKFDNLPGRGKPLHLDETNPHADPDWELAYHMLKEAGYSLPWIEAMREIEADVIIARQDLQLAWEWRRSALAEYQPAGLIQAEWDGHLAAFKDKLAAINKHIRDYNLQVPQARFQRALLNSDQEIRRITGD